MNKMDKVIERYETCINILQNDDSNGTYYEILEEAEGDYNWASQGLEDWLNQMLSQEYEELSDYEIEYYTEILQILKGDL